jgi:hypothetical protein
LSQAANWAAKWDANSLIILRRALLGFDTRPDFARIKAKVLYILCRTDALFPPKIAPDVIKTLTAAGVEACYFELDSDLGHSSSGPEHAKWSPVLREFLAPLGGPAELRRLAASQPDPHKDLSVPERRTIGFASQAAAQNSWAALPRFWCPSKGPF